MFLVTTSLKEFWDTDDELLLLGPWCMRFEDPRWLEGLRCRRLPNVWDDRALLERSSRYCLDIQPGLLSQLAAHLNAAHGTGLSARYWRVLAGPWLLLYTHHLLDRYRQLSAALTSHPDLTTWVLSPQDFRVPRDTTEFIRLMVSDSEHYDLQIYSLILRQLGKSFPERRRAAPLREPTPQERASLLSRLKRKLKDVRGPLLSWAIGALRADIVSDDLCPTGPPLLWRLVRRMRGRLVPLLRSMPESRLVPAVMDERRLGLSKMEGVDEFTRILVSTLPSALPTILLEGFGRAREFTLGRSRHVPRAILGGTQFSFNDYFKMAAAEWAERGARLLGFQHGGFYGTSRMLLSEWHERGISDRFFTWGWSAGESDGKARDLPVPSLSERAARGGRAKAAPRSDILLISSELMKNSHHLFSTPIGWQWEEYFSFRERFIGALGPLSDSLLLRLPPQDYGWHQKQLLQRRFPDLRFDDRSTPFHERLARTRLAVSDHPSTTLLETLALDVPSINFWQEDRWEMRAEAAPYFKALRDSGILHADPESAALKISQVYENPSAWWDSAPTQAARRAFVERYARTRANWLDVWVNELEREAAGPLRT